MTQAARFRELMRRDGMVVAPGAYDCITARLIERAGFDAVYMTGAGTAATLGYPDFGLVTMSEMVGNAGRIATAVDLPVIADADTGYGNELNVVRTVREYEAAGVAGIHIEDQLYPKRAHYHAYQVHAIPLAEFVAKIKYACRQRDETDPDFVIIARSDTAREFGLDEAMLRINTAAEVGADLGLVFPRDRDEAEAAPRLSSVPLIWVQSRGNRDGRPILPLNELCNMGYRGCIDAQVMLGVAVHFVKRAIAELVSTGNYTGLSDAEFVTVRKEIEDLIGLDAYYRIEAETVEPGSRPR